MFILALKCGLFTLFFNNNIRFTSLDAQVPLKVQRLIREPCLNHFYWLPHSCLLLLSFFDHLHLTCGVVPKKKYGI